MSLIECAGQNSPCGDLLHTGAREGLFGGCHQDSDPDPPVRGGGGRRLALPHRTGGLAGKPWERGWGGGISLCI